ncbi:MAG: hypothetical protein ACREX8_15725 [Gammaproteobacteria bacterium]
MSGMFPTSGAVSALRVFDTGIASARRAMTELTRPFMELSQRVERMTGTVSALRAIDIIGPSSTETVLRSFTEHLQPLRETLRLLGEQQAAAEETEQALAALPKQTLRQLTVTTVRCPAGSLLLRVVRIPDHLPGARYDRHLVIPTSAVTYGGFGERITAPAWFLADQDALDVQCRCHPRPTTLTPQQLRGESSPPPGIRVLNRG